MFKAGVLIAATATAGFVGCVSAREPSRTLQHDHQTMDLDSAALTRVHLAMGAGELHVSGGAAKLIEADFDYNVPAWKPAITRKAGPTESDVEIVQGSQAPAVGATDNRWTLSLNDATPLQVTANLGAGEAHFSLGRLDLRGVDVHMGAGEMEMDLRGTPKESYTVDVHGGVGTATIHVPASVPISASASGGIGDIQVTGLEKRNGRWVNPRVPSGPAMITLDVTGGVGTITIVAD